MSKQTGSSARQLTEAQRAVQQARRRVASSAGALQYRLKPGTLMTNAWSGVKDKSGVMADDALQVVKARPVTVSGVIAAIVIFLARDPLWDFISGLFSRSREEDASIVRANLEDHKGNFDLTAPTVAGSVNEGVNA